MSFPVFTEEALEDLFDPVALERAYGYLHKVSDLRITDAGALYAQVQGNRQRPYLCSVRLKRVGDRLRLEGQCTCPVGYACKHMAAALLAWHAQQRSAVQRPTLSPAVQYWRDGLTQEVAELLQRGAAGGDQLLYLLSLDPGGRLRIGLVVSARLKDGSWGKPRRFAGLGGEPQPFLTPDDLRLLRRWLAMRWQADEPLNPLLGAEIVAGAIATGRAFWQRVAGPALARGEPRPARMVWRTNDRGGQSTALELMPPATLSFPLIPPWYLDAEAGCCGPIESPLPPEVLHRLLSIPALTPEEAALLAPELLSLGADLGVPLPLPAAIEVELIEEPPVACLQLEGRDLRKRTRRRWDEQPVHLDYARLSFDYGGQRVDAGDLRTASFQRFVQGRAVRVRRRFDLERAAVERLAPHLLPLTGVCRQEERCFYQPEPAGWVRFIGDVLPQLRQEGWRVSEAAGFNMKVVTPQEWYAQIAEEGNDWFTLGLDVELDGERQPLLPLLVSILRGIPDMEQLLTESPPDEELLGRLPDGRILRLPLSRVRPLLATLVELYRTTPLDDHGRLRLPRARSTVLERLDAATPLRWQGGERLRELAGRLREVKGLTAVEPPAGLAATLRGYQREGLAWLQFLREFGFGGVLADDMGLGKTVQALAHLLVERAAGRLDRPALVVAPTSLMLNWRREARQFAPELKVLTLHGLERREQFDRIPEHDLVLTTYPLLPRDEQVLLQHEFHLVILDEAQTIKNPRARAAQVATQLHARHRLCLTGTPLENHLGELWSLFNFLMPGLLGDEAEFRRLYRNPIEKQGDDQRRHALAQRVGPFMLRRTKAEVVTELPPKTEIVRTVELSGAQRDLYETVRISMLEKVREEIEKKGVERSHIVILDALLKLRQICCDPRLLRLDSARRVKESAKLDLLTEMLPEMVAEGRRILLFSQFTSMLSLIELTLRRLKLPFVTLTGDTRDRETPINRFQDGQVPIFLISLKAGGVGLNLTAADTVIHYDPWWNPAVENQATDRAYRIGQDKPVFVYRLLTEGTVEERIAEMQLRKRQLAEALLAEGATQATALDGEDLARLFDPI